MENTFDKNSIFYLIYITDTGRKQKECIEIHCKQKVKISYRFAQC